MSERCQKVKVPVNQKMAVETQAMGPKGLPESCGTGMLKEFL